MAAAVGAVAAFAVGAFQYVKERERGRLLSVADCLFKFGNTGVCGGFLLGCANGGK